MWIAPYAFSFHVESQIIQALLKAKAIAVNFYTKLRNFEKIN